MLYMIIINPISSATDLNTDDEQIWFFIWESTKTSLRYSPYMQGWLPFPNAKQHVISLEKALAISAANKKPDDQSNSMKAVVELRSRIIRLFLEIKL